MNCTEINDQSPIELLNNYKILPVSKSGDNYLFHAFYRRDQKPSLSVNNLKKVWIDFGTGNKGRNVDLLMMLYNTSNVSEMLKRFNSDMLNKSFSFSQLKEKTSSIKSKLNYEIIKIKEIDSFSLKNYLQNRGISKKTYSPYLRQLHYKNESGNYYGIAFKNDSGGYEVRNAMMKNNICLGKKDISSFINSPDQLIFFEGFFDFLSFIELGKYDQQSVIVLNTVNNTGSGLQKARTIFTEMAKVETFLDNDPAGINATEEIKKTFLETIDRCQEYPNHNDLNDFLRAKRKGRNRGRGPSI